MTIAKNREAVRGASVRKFREEPLPRVTFTDLTQPKRNGITLSRAVEDYLLDISATHDPDTVKNRRKLFEIFTRQMGNKYLADIRRRDLLDYMTYLRENGSRGRGDSSRTVRNKIEVVRTFLRHYEIVGLLKPYDLPKYTLRKVDSYDLETLQILSAAATEEEWYRYQFFLTSGERDQELQYTTWRDINFSDRTASVTEKPEWKFHPKDFEERTIPLPDYLIAALIERRKKNPDARLLFDNGYGRPDKNLLKKLKKLALRAGLNCGLCIRKDTLESEACRKHSVCDQMKCKSCCYHPVCTNFSLHKFRRTFASMLMEAQTEVRTIQYLLGHSDISTTMRYLRVVDARSPKMRSQINNAFAAAAIARR